MKRISLSLFTILFILFSSKTGSAQKMSKWEKGELKKEKKERQEYEKLDKANAKADKEAIASLQKGVSSPLISRLGYYFVRNATVFYGSGTGYNTGRDEKNWATAHTLIDAANAIPGAYTLELERATDSLLLERTNISLMLSQSFDSFPANNLLSTLKYLRKKDYSPEANIRLAKLYKWGFNLYRANGYASSNSRDTWVQSFDSAYKFIYDAAVAGSATAMGMLGDFKIYGDGDIYKRPSPVTYKYLDTISAGIWYKKQFDALYANKAILTYDDSLSSYMLYKIAYGPGDIDAKGIECYKNKDTRKAYQYWLASASFRNSAYAFYRIGYLYYYGEGSRPQWPTWAIDFFKQAGDLGYAPGYYAAGLTEDFGSAKRGQYFQKAIAMGYKPAGDALSKDNARIDEMNRISMEKAKTLNYYTADDDDDDGNTTSLKKGNTQSRQSSTRTCSSCGGSGQQHTTIPGGAKKNGVTIFGEYHTCSACNGKGYY
jgi:hypothetical protein